MIDRICSAARQIDMEQKRVQYWTSLRWCSRWMTYMASRTAVDASRFSARAARFIVYWYSLLILALFLSVVFGLMVLYRSAALGIFYVAHLCAWRSQRPMQTEGECS